PKRDTLIVLETMIAAPVERCFLLSSHIGLHLDSFSSTREQAIAGVTHGLIRGGETVTWRGRHFGVMLHHESVISIYDPPRHFRDEMLRSIFRSYVHDHFFDSTDSGTLMRDEIRFAAPLGGLGYLAERLAVRRHLEQLVEQRNRTIRHVAEGDGWRVYLEGNEV